jgi:hypothetical protein
MLRTGCSFTGFKFSNFIPRANPLPSAGVTFPITYWFTHSCGVKTMKLSYRGVKYNYNPPTFAGSVPAAHGVYRGTAFSSEQPIVDISVPEQELTYRGVAYHRGGNKAATRAVAMAGVANQSLNVDELARRSMTDQRMAEKHLQDSMWARAATEMGLDIDWTDSHSH